MFFWLSYARPILCSRPKVKFSVEGLSQKIHIHRNLHLRPFNTGTLIWQFNCWCLLWKIPVFQLLNQISASLAQNDTLNYHQVTIFPLFLFLPDYNTKKNQIEFILKKKCKGYIRRKIRNKLQEHIIPREKCSYSDNFSLRIILTKKTIFSRHIQRYFFCVFYYVNDTLLTSEAAARRFLYGGVLKKFSSPATLPNKRPQHRRFPLNFTQF